MTDPVQTYDVSSIGCLNRNSIDMFAHRYEDEKRWQIFLNDIAVGEKFFVVFKSGTGLTRTSAVRTA